MKTFRIVVLFLASVHLHTTVLSEDPTPLPPTDNNTTSVASPVNLTSQQLPVPSSTSNPATNLTTEQGSAPTTTVITKTTQLPSGTSMSSSGGLDNHTIETTTKPEQNANSSSQATTPTPFKTDAVPTKNEMPVTAITGTNMSEDLQNQTHSSKEVGPDQKENPEEEVTDKKLLWVLLSVLGVGVAAVIVIVKFRCMKVHNHTEMNEQDHENASYQNRPDSSKDGVMLLGVKSSGGEVNAVAR